MDQQKTKTTNEGMGLIIALGGFWVWNKLGVSEWLPSGLSVKGLSISIATVLVVMAMSLLLLKEIKKTEKSSKLGKALKLGKRLLKKGFFDDRDFSIGLSQFRHSLVTGVTGAGKSTFLRKFMDEVLRNRSSFFYVDFKGEGADYDELLQICRKHGVEKDLQVFDLSDPKHCQSINLLTIFKEIEETVGFVMGMFFDEETNPYYRNEAERFLRCALTVMSGAAELPTFVKLREMYFDDHYRNHLLKRAERLRIGAPSYEESFFLNEFNELKAREKSDRYSGFISVLSSFCCEELREILNPDGAGTLKLNWALTENTPVVIRVPGEKYGALSERITVGLIKTLPVMLAERRSMARKKDYFIILDEACSYLNETMLDLCKKAGSAQVKLLVTRMADADFESVGSSFLGRMISTFSVFYCFQTVCPETREMMSRLAMTLEDQKTTSRVSQGSMTGDGSVREVQRFRIHPNEFGELGVGECYVISPQNRIYEKIKVLAPVQERASA